MSNEVLAVSKNDEMSLVVQHQPSLMTKWNTSEQMPLVQGTVVNMEGSKAFKSLIHDYLNHEILVSSNDEAAKLSQILHGH